MYEPPVLSAASENRSASLPIASMPLGKCFLICFFTPSISGGFSTSTRLSNTSSDAPLTMSSGSITLPLVFDIFLPLSSVTVDVR